MLKKKKCDCDRVIFALTRNYSRTFLKRFSEINYYNRESCKPLENKSFLDIFGEGFIWWYLFFRHDQKCKLSSLIYNLGQLFLSETQYINMRNFIPNYDCVWVFLKYFTIFLSGVFKIKQLLLTCYQIPLDQGFPCNDTKITYFAYYKRPQLKHITM